MEVNVSILINIRFGLIRATFQNLNEWWDVCKGYVTTKINVAEQHFRQSKIRRERKIGDKLVAEIYIDNSVTERVDPTSIVAVLDSPVLT